ncbi:MAG: glutamate--tRNA ligase [Gammaproteobacteria bacterium]
MSVVTRFPPSPTGYLHIGSVRTALFNWLYARGAGGKFILRIEDTDRARSSQEAVDIILAGMEWLGLDYDEGPYYQSRRFDRYRDVSEQLLREDKAYHCYCSKERLEKLRTDQMAQKRKPRYDGYCRELLSAPPSDILPVVRFRTPQEGGVAVADKVHGYINTSNEELDDLVIARSDGTPTYHLTVVVDDIDMGITHVIRGDDHINNTPRQVHILEALGAERPVYAHVPMINGADGKKLSKRHGAVSVLDYRVAGFLPDALTNYLARLGWAHGDQEIFTRVELTDAFDFEGLNKSAATFDWDKLTWLNQQYIQNASAPDLLKFSKPYFESAQIDLGDGPDITAAVEAQRTRAKTLVDIADQSRMFYGELTRDEDAAKKYLRPVVGPTLKAIREKFASVAFWDGATLKDIVEQTATEFEMKMGKVAQPLRVAVTGSSASPSIDITLELVGRERCLQRLDSALAYIAARAAA